jgi:hypothetical protein
MNIINLSLYLQWAEMHGAVWIIWLEMFVFMTWAFYRLVEQ